MATLDVSEALDYEEFQSIFGIIRRQSRVDESGLNVLLEVPTVIARGVVQAAGARDIEKLPEAFRASSAIKIYYKGNLSALSNDEKGEYPDIVIWKNKSWEVKAVDDWQNYGAGYVKAICVMDTANNGE